LEIEDKEDHGLSPCGNSVAMAHIWNMALYTIYELYSALYSMSDTIYNTYNLYIILYFLYILLYMLYIILYIEHIILYIPYIFFAFIKTDF
jgi:hypothetical protein